MEVCLRAFMNGFIHFVICSMVVACKTSWNQRSQTNFHSIKYINLIYMYLLLLYNSSISDIEGYPSYIALGLPQTPQVNEWQPTLSQYIYLCVCVCVCVCVYIYIYIHTQTHTHICSRQRCRCLNKTLINKLIIFFFKLSENLL